jgi:hypothetical protein
MRCSPVFQELRALVLKTFGLADVLREALAPDTAASDIDLMVVADNLTYPELFAALEEASAQPLENLAGPDKPLRCVVMRC